MSKHENLFISHGNSFRAYLHMGFAHVTENDRHMKCTKHGYEQYSLMLFSVKKTDIFTILIRTHFF